MQAGDLVAARYRLLRSIGEGGMGSVWAAHHELIGRDVAIKVTGERLAQRTEIRERFLNEARAVGKLRHPNVIDVMDVGQLPDGRLYIVFELLEGHTLGDQLQKMGRLSAGDAVMIVIEMCRGLEAAHAAGIVHRDLKPANIFLHRGPMGGIVIKLLDFGISKTIDDEGVSLSMTQTGMVMGTPQYMSVEQARGRDDIDLRTDVWGVGAILYELLAGKLPFDASNYNAMLDKIIHEDPVPFAQWKVDVPPALQSVVLRCLAKQRAQRFQTAKEVREGLEALLPSLPVGSAGLLLERGSGLLPASMIGMHEVGGSPSARHASLSPEHRQAQQRATIEGPVENPPSSSGVAVWNDAKPAGRRAGWTAVVAFAVVVSGGGMYWWSRPASETHTALAASAAPEVSAPRASASVIPRAELAQLPLPAPVSELHASAAASGAPPHKPSPPRARPAEPSKARAVTKVDSAGF